MGDGISEISIFSNSSTPSPVLALTKGDFEALIPTISSISFFTLSGSA